MDSMEFNKIAGAAIGALLVFLLLNFFSGLIYGTRGAEHGAEGQHGPVLAYAVPVEAEAGAGEAEEPQIDLLALFQAADASAGESTFRACGACHSTEPGENKIGPSLHGVVGRDIASAESFAYSDAMLAQEGAWTPEHLFAFLGDPEAVVPGTKMSYAGMDDPADRANLIAYLNQIGGAPVDLTEGIEPLAPAGDAAEAAAGTEVAAAGDAATDPAEATAEGVPGEDQGAGVTGEAPPVVTPESMTETTTSSQPPAQPDSTVVEVETVDVGKENVDVTSTTPLEIEKAAPAPAASEEAGPAEQPVTQESPAEAAAPAQEGGEQVAAAPAEAAAPAAPGGDAAAGEKVFRRCMACHKVEEGQNAIGPSLHGIVGRDIASVEGFEYSDAMAAHEGVWTPELLSQFLADPKGTIPGTKMAFAGLKDEQDRIDVITYLQQAAQ